MTYNSIINTSTASIALLVDVSSVPDVGYSRAPSAAASATVSSRPLRPIVVPRYFEQKDDIVTTL